jgi:hypothetical protein
MSGEATSLDRLHDLVPPADVSWWPLAPGWYFLLAFVFVLGLVLLIRFWRNWQANAYRRAALQELASASTVPAVAELLRRTALVAAPRTLVSRQTGQAWLDWLEQQYPEPMPDNLRPLLIEGVYGRPGKDPDITELRKYAAGWISHHKGVALPSMEENNPSRR